MEVKNSSDDLWIGVKGQSNLVIAGSLRNIFRYSVMLEVVTGVEHMIGTRAYTKVTNPVKLRNTLHGFMASTGESGR